MQTMAENAFVNTNRYPKNNYPNNEEIVNYKRTKTITHNPSAHNSIEPLSESATQEKSETGKRNDTVDPASSSATKKQSENPVRKLFQACGRCCRGKKAKIVKSKTSFVEYIKEKTKKCRTKKSRSKQPAAATAEHPDREDKQERKTGRSKKAKKKRRKREHKKRTPEEHPLDVTVPSPAALEPDQHGKLLNQILGADGQDFKKSCCYLCAKSAMAIAAAISGQKDKSHVSIQTSVRFKEKSTMDQSCSPMMYVRTVQSSVKVKTRDMGTLHPEKKRKSKKARPKLNFKRFSIIPKVKFPGYPRVRTVACETDKSMGHNNIPQCRARRGTHCITENK